VHVPQWDEGIGSGDCGAANKIGETGSFGLENRSTAERSEQNGFFGWIQNIGYAWSSWISNSYKVIQTSLRRIAIDTKPGLCENRGPAGFQVGILSVGTGGVSKVQRPGGNQQLLAALRSSRLRDAPGRSRSFGGTEKQPGREQRSGGERESPRAPQDIKTLELKKEDQEAQKVWKRENKD